MNPGMEFYSITLVVLINIRAINLLHNSNHDLLLQFGEIVGKSYKLKLFALYFKLISSHVTIAEIS